jgi:hypothetical protein
MFDGTRPDIEDHVGRPDLVDGDDARRRVIGLVDAAANSPA